MIEAHIHDIKIEMHEAMHMRSVVLAIYAIVSFYNDESSLVPRAWTSKERCQCSFNVPQEIYDEMPVEHRHRLLIDMARKLAKDIALRRDKLEYERLQNLHTSEQIREIQAIAEAAGAVARNSGAVPEPLSPYVAASPSRGMGRSYVAGGTTGDSPFYAGHDDRWSGFGTG
jgi:hypothetical protein